MTGQRHAVTFRIKPGTEARAQEILSTYGRPEAEVDPYTRLLATTVLIKDDVIVRIIEIEGSILTVMQHLSRQPAVQAVEAALNPILVEDRDLSTSSGTRNFYMRAIMDPVADPAPVVPPADRDPGAQPYAVLYVFQVGRGPEADGCFTSDGATSVFRNGDIAVRYYESPAGDQVAIDHLARAGLAEGSGPRLQALLSTTADLTTEEGWRRFVSNQLMQVATHRVAPPTTLPAQRRPSRVGPETIRRTTNKVIDFHTHLVPERWARMGNVPPQMIDVGGYFAAKEAVGIETSVIINAMFHHPASREDVRGLPMQREFIDFAHDLMAAHPGAVTALVGVNPFAGDEALRAMEEAIRGGGFPGVTVNTSIDGELLDSPRAAGFWALVAELDAPVFLHPPLYVTPQQVDWDPRFLGFAVRPLDVTLCVAAIVTAGILEKYPRLRIVCASGGGTLAELAERLNLAYSQIDLGLMPDSALRAGASALPAAELTARPSEYIRHLYVDTCVHGTHALLANLDLFGPGRMVFGTDSPPVLVSMVGEIETIESVLTTDDDRQQVLWRNAADLLGLSGQPSAQIPATRTATSKI